MILMRRYHFFQITQTQAHVRLPKAAVMQTNSILQYTSPNICMAKSMAKSESEPGKYSTRNDYFMRNEGTPYH